MSSLERSPRNPLADLVGYRLRRASSALMADLANELTKLGLTTTEASILQLIGANPGITQSEIGRTLGIKRANMAPLARRLDENGLVQRERVNGRSHGLAVTLDGDALCRRARATMDRHEARFMRRLSAPERAGLLDALDLLGLG